MAEERKYRVFVCDKNAEGRMLMEAYYAGHGLEKIKEDAARYFRNHIDYEGQELFVGHYTFSACEYEAFYNIINELTLAQKVDFYRIPNLAKRWVVLRDDVMKAPVAGDYHNGSQQHDVDKQVQQEMFPNDEYGWSAKDETNFRTAVDALEEEFGAIPTAPKKTIGEILSLPLQSSIKADGGFQIRHAEWGVFQGEFIGLGFWHPTSEQPEQGFCYFPTELEASNFIDYMTVDGRYDKAKFSVEPFDKETHNKLIIGQSTDETIVLPDSPPTEAREMKAHACHIN